MKFLLSEKSRNDLFDFLKNNWHVPTYKELSLKMKIPSKTLQNWRLGICYIPSKIVPKEFDRLEILDEKVAKPAGSLLGVLGVVKELMDMFGDFHRKVKKGPEHGGE